MNNWTLIEILEKLYQQASENLTDSCKSNNKRKVEAIADVMQTAPIRF